jgi:hypothetical protein
MCEDSTVRFVASALLVYLVRRVRPMTVAVAMVGAWQRLPLEQRRRLMVAARRQATGAASSLVRRGRPRF